MRDLFLLVLLATAVPGPVQAAGGVVTPAPRGGGAMFALPGQESLLGVLDFVRWSRRSEASALMARHPRLSALRRLDPSDSNQLRALTPLLERLSSEQLLRVAGIGGLAAERQETALQDLEDALRQAGEGVGRTALERVAAAVKDESTDWTSLAAEMRPLALYGSWAEPVAKKLEDRAARVKAARTETSVRETAEKLVGRTAASSILKIEGNVIHVDFSKGPATAPGAQTGAGAKVIGMPKPEERTPPPWAVAQRKELMRQIKNNEILLDSDLGSETGKIQADLRARREEYAGRLRALEARYPRLTDGSPVIAARRTRTRSPVPAEAAQRYQALHEEASELGDFIYRRDKAWTLPLTGRFAEYRRLRSDPRYRLANSTLAAKWLTATGEMEILELKHPGLGVAFEPPVAPGLAGRQARLLLVLSALAGILIGLSSWAFLP